MTIKTVKFTLGSLSIAFSLHVYAEDSLSLNTSLGILSGESHEYVYSYPASDTKLSQLNWRIKNAAIIKGEANYDFLGYSISGRGWITIDNSKAPLDDYDWFNPYQATWTDWSHSNNTLLSFANELELNLKIWFRQTQNYKLGLLFGYQWNSFSWRSLGGYYEYNNGTEIGYFPEEMLLVGYRQKFKTPFVGLAGKYLINRFEFNALLKISQWVSARDHDEHYARNMTFNEHGINGSGFAAVHLNAGYFLTERATLFVEGSYNQYSNARANLELINNTTHARGYYSDLAGLSNTNYTIALGLRYRF